MNDRTVKEVILAVDVVLEAMIGPSPGYIEALIAQAENGEIKLSLSHLALYCAVYSVKEHDNFNAQRLAQLLRLVQIIPEEPEYPGPEERNSWIPKSHEVENWRGYALGERG